MPLLTKNLLISIMSRIANASAAWFTLLYAIPALVLGILALLFGAASIWLLMDSEYGPFFLGAIITVVLAFASYRLSPYYKKRS
jgi:nicotinamide riboside transporter PnuC